MHPRGERIERVRLGARSAARDLLRLVRALDVRGVDLGALADEHRAALETVNQELAAALTRIERPEDHALDQAEASIAGTRALLRAPRRAALAGRPGGRRLQGLAALLAVEVRDADLAAAPVRPARSGGVAAARRRAERRGDARRRAERSRQ